MACLSLCFVHLNTYVGMLLPDVLQTAPVLSVLGGVGLVLYICVSGVDT